MTHFALQRRAAVALAAALLAAAAAAQQQVVKPPKVRLWIDLSTGGMAGMPEMDAMPGGGMLGGLFGGGGGAAGRGGAGHTSYGLARTAHVAPARVLDIALYNSLRPGREAQQVIPAGMRLGASLPLLPPPPSRAEPAQREGAWSPEDPDMPKPRGRILLYWGCGEAVRAGQPRVIDLARMAAGDASAAAALQGRMAPDRGARVGAQHALYPNERTSTALPQGASLVGEHRIEGEGVPAGTRFTLGAEQDIMPAINLASRGALADSVALSWGEVPRARAYFLHALASVGDDLVLWSSSEVADAGMGLLDYLPNASIDRWLGERVLLRPQTTACAVPRGIFKGADGAMLRMTAHGSESNLAHPPRPADARQPWEPDWAVRVRVKSTTLAMLGQDVAATAPRGAPGQAPAAGTPAAAGQEAAPAAQPAPGIPGLPGLPGLPSPGGVLRGIFQR